MNQSNKTKRILITGATGFVGHHLCKLLSSLDYDVVGTTRRDPSSVPNPGFELKMLPDLSDGSGWKHAFQDVDYVVHLAARVHVMKETEMDPLEAFRRVNVEGTRRLLRNLSAQGVEKLVYLSSIKVHGEATTGRAWTASDVVTPVDPYARSKFEAEQLIRESGVRNGFETVIIRPPLVYGPGVGGNILRLLKVVDKGIPLPLGRVDNLRSMVSVQNLCDLIRECLSNPAAAGRLLLVSDASDISTPDLVRMIASAMSKPARLMPISPSILSFLGKLTGRSAEVERLTASLQVDVGETLRLLDWRPPVSVDEGIRDTVRWYQEQTRRAT